MIVKLEMGKEHKVENKIIRIVSMADNAINVSIEDVKHSYLIQKLEKNISNVIRFKRKQII